MRESAVFSFFLFFFLVLVVIGIACMQDRCMWWCIVARSLVECGAGVSVVELLELPCEG